jgi:hypothetical protein
MRGRTALSIGILTFFALIGPFHAALAETPTWLLFEQGVLEMDRGEYGHALHFFLQAQEKKRIFPEVEIAIGDIYKIQGEIKIAEAQYLKAYRQKDAFEVPDDRYIALYRLAQLYKERRENDNWKQILENVLSEDEVYYRDRFQRLHDVFLKVFLDRGIDRLLVLYRLDSKHATRAHGELGEYYNRSFLDNRIERRRLAESAMIHYLFAVVTLLSDVIEEIRFWDPDFLFTDLNSLFRRIGSRPQLLEYIRETAIFKYLYYLAVASYAGGYEERADELWSVLEAEPLAGRYRSLSKSQLLDPRVAPLLYID